MATFGGGGGGSGGRETEIRKEEETSGNDAVFLAGRRVSTIGASPTRPLRPLWLGVDVGARRAQRSGVLKEGDDGGMVVSLDGNHVYVASANQNSVVSFSRDAFDIVNAATDDLTISANVTASGGNGIITLSAVSDILQTSGTVSAAGSGDVDINASTGTTDGVITMSAGTCITPGSKTR